MDNYRAEARNAGAALHTAVERLNARLQQEEAQLNVVRAEAANAAQAEAAVLGSLRGQVRGRGGGEGVRANYCSLYFIFHHAIPMPVQVAELQNVLSGMGQQLQNIVPA